MLIDYHRMMAETISLGGSVSAGANYLLLAKDYWSLSRRFGKFLRHVNQLRSAREEYLRELAGKLMELHCAVADLIRTSKSKGLLNHALTAASLRSVMAQNEQLMDQIDAFEVALNPATKANFEEALRELRAGETVSLESLRI